MKNGHIQLNIRTPKEIININKVTKTEKEFDTVKFFREVKVKIAKEAKGMNFAELKECIYKRLLLKQSVLPIF